MGYVPRVFRERIETFERYLTLLGLLGLSTMLNHQSFSALPDERWAIQSNWELHFLDSIVFR